ncbi:MAG: hypothetical protein ACNFW9_02610 [Candidatus Kerfeldbacteria bacterium]
MYVEKLDEQVRVFVDFNGVKVKPVSFIRSAGRRYDISNVNLVYKKKIGDRYYWCFAVSDEVNNYILFYDPDNLIWTLKEVQMDG